MPLRTLAIATLLKKDCYMTRDEFYQKRNKIVEPARMASDNILSSNKRCRIPCRKNIRTKISDTRLFRKSNFNNIEKLQQMQLLMSIRFKRTITLLLRFTALWFKLRHHFFYLRFNNGTILLQKIATSPSDFY